MTLDNFLILYNKTMREALSEIDANIKGFLMVVDQEQRLMGTLTDGDLRRAFLQGASLEDSIEKAYQKDFTCIGCEDTIATIIDIFKDTRIEFLPIVAKDKTVLNVITKQNMHALLLQDMDYAYDLDWINMDDSIVENEIFQRPWGFYKTTVLNQYFQSKIIRVDPRGALSLQEHHRREEHWIVVHGEGQVQLDLTKRPIRVGEHIYIPTGCKHRLINTSDTESLIITEVQLGDYFGEDDIIRFEDVYGRE
ncbi:CBS domain-containing protein [Eubacterium oxidoreducens]|uniref:Mannose-1-phosphate guanylyltransferase / mannose-6-phosphate isomerase n=1 Tax=Eubacterium oxidoreducens TaxID=1732 RepID=A0A1G6BSE8_EUBOX|nr:CBS domain-containing protein [Eubacterium oxidoreducens]SDB23457.1 mannose-1-phosphate guanylyltransferase / mannose-6-phosphate isomerase [Eubacterium oxidoreducens]